MDRWLLFLVHLVGSLVSKSSASEDMGIPQSVFACAGVDEEEQQGNIYMEVVGRPSDLQNGHLHVLEDALVSLYASASAEVCANGYRHLTGAKINTGSIPSSNQVRTFVIDFQVTGRCKGCSRDLNFFSHSRRATRIRSGVLEPGTKMRRKMSSKKESKRSSIYYGSAHVDSGAAGSCLCLPPSDDALDAAFHQIIDDILDLGNIYEDTSQSHLAPGYDDSGGAFSSLASDDETDEPTQRPTDPGVGPTDPPVLEPTLQPQSGPTVTPPVSAPTAMPVQTPVPSTNESVVPTTPSIQSSSTPTISSSSAPTATITEPTSIPSLAPSTSSAPTATITEPTSTPSLAPSTNPSTVITSLPSSSPSLAPSTNPSAAITSLPSSSPSLAPSTNPSTVITSLPSSSPSLAPSTNFSTTITSLPSSSPSLQPSPDPTPATTPPPTPATTPTTTPPPTPPPTQPTNSYCDETNSPITYRSANCDKGTQPGFQICMEFLNMPCEDAPLFDTALQFWEAAVTSDIPDHTIPLNFLEDAGFCGPGYDPPDPADDLYICGQYTNIDGGSGVLGTGTSVNDGSGIPKPILWGILRLDTDDRTRLQNDQGLYYDVILHEIGHVLGIGNNWRLANEPLVNSDCEYIGPAATAVYRELSGCTDGFPLVECTNGHWSEDCFDAELLTPARNSGGVLISEMTVASLDDIGYTTDRDAVEYDFSTIDIAEECRCNTAPGNLRSGGGLLWQWKNPTKRRWNAPSPELQELAKAHVPQLSPRASNNTMESTVTIGTSTTVLFWYEEDDRFYEVTV